MEFQLDKVATETREKLLAQLEQSGTVLATAIENFNAIMRAAWVQVHEAQMRHNYNIAQAQGFIEDVIERHQSLFDAKPERWQQSKAGEMAADWLAEWDVELEASAIEPPDDIDPEEYDEAEQTLRELPNQPG